MSLSRCGESIDEPYPANHPVDASDCKRALDSGVRRCKHSLGANIPFAAMSFFVASTMPQRQAVGVLRRRSPLRFADTRSTQGCGKHATCWLGRSVCLAYSESTGCIV